MKRKTGTSACFVPAVFSGSLVRLKVPHGQCTERALCTFVTFYLCDIRDEISLRVHSTIHNILSLFSFLNLFSERKMQLVTSVVIWYDLKWLFYQDIKSNVFIITESESIRDII